MFIIPGKNLQLWVASLKQKSYLLCVRKEIMLKKIENQNSHTKNFKFNN